MYRKVNWGPSSPLSSSSFSQMTLNDEENYIDVATSTSKVLAVAQMTKVFESMPGNNPSQISPLCIDIFRAPYTGWYRVHLSCSSARQEIKIGRAHV